MLILLSPAKTLDMQPVDVPTTQPRLMSDTEELAAGLRTKTASDLQKLMKISENLADLNYRRFQDFATPFDRNNAAPSGFAFQGDVYQDLEYANFTERERELANKQIRILSGFYGVLRPSDLMQAYRLEMGTRYANERGKNLYDFWGDRITTLLNEDLAKTDDDTVLNLASKEYFKSVNQQQLAGRLLTVHFKEERDDKLKIITFNAKKARGRMAQLITLEGLTSPAGMKDLVVNGYRYDDSVSTTDEWTYVKRS